MPSIQNLFEPFYRVPGTPVKDKRSVGLGLSIVKEIVEGHGGTIQIDSKISKGTVATIRFSLSQG
jgi:two-component system phosphate regulon sensor histidine kinase PhoR